MCSCFCLLWCFGHRCWEFHPDICIIFPEQEAPFTLAHYLNRFLDDINRARTIEKPKLVSVLYCRTRGPSAYPFLIVRMKHPELQARPIVLKLQGFDGVPTVKEPWDTWEPYDTPEEGCTFTVAGVEQSVRQLVGTRRYDVYQTMQCRRGTIVDLLVLAELATERDRTRAVYPATLFLALQDVCRGVVMSSSTRRSAIFPIDVAIESKNAVVDAFPARRQQMEERIWRQLGFGSLEAEAVLASTSLGSLVSVAEN